MTRSAYSIIKYGTITKKILISRTSLSSQLEEITRRSDRVALARSSSDDVVRLGWQTEDWRICSVAMGWILYVPAISLGRFFFSVLFLNVLIAVTLGTIARRTIVRIVKDCHRRDAHPINFPQEES